MNTTETPLDSKRIVSVDFFRGLAILGVVLTHCLIYGVFYSTANALATVPVGLLAVLSPIVLISPMAGLFAFISVTANTFTALRRFENGAPAKNVIQPLLITSAALIVIHFLFSLLLKNSSASMFDPGETLNTLIPASIRQGEWIFPKFENLLFMDAMAMIAMSGFTAAAVIAVLLKCKTPRDRALRILALAGFAAAVLSPYIWYLFWIPFEYFYRSEGALRLLAIPLSFFAARMHSLPGIFPFIMFGLWFGILLRSKPTYAEVRRKTRPPAIASLILLIVFVGLKLLFTLGRETPVGAFFENAGVITAVAENSPAVWEGKVGNAFLDYKTLPTEFQFFGAALIFWGFPLLLKIFDFRQPQDKAKIAGRVHPVIRFGTLSLTVFVCETTVHTLFAKILHTLSGVPVPDMKNIQPDFFMTHPAVWLSYAVFMILLWGVILKFWEKTGYRFSLEWILVKATAPLRRIKSEKLPPAPESNRPRS